MDEEQLAQLARQRSYGAFVGRAMRQYQLDHPMPGPYTTPARWVTYRPPFPEHYQFKMRWLTKPTTRWEVYKGHHFLGRVSRMDDGGWGAWRAPIEAVDVLVEDFFKGRHVDKCLGFRRSRAKAAKLLLDWHADPSVEPPLSDPGPFKEAWPGKRAFEDFLAGAPTESREKRGCALYAHLEKIRLKWAKDFTWLLDLGPHVPNDRIPVFLAYVRVRFNEEAVMQNGPTWGNELPRV